MDADSTIASPVLVPLRQTSRRSSLTSSSSANSRLCNCVVKEIIATEQQYVCDLRDLVNSYLAHFRNGGLLTMTEVHDIFGNIEDIYRLNSSFLADIESCSEDPIRMANCFYRRCPEFDVYAAYCTNYPRSQTTLAYAQARPAVQEAFRRHQDRLGHSLPVSSYLHKPVQRVLKYPLLLQNLQKYYDGQLDSKRCIEAALRAIREMANHINEAKRASEHAAQAQQLLGSSSSEYDVSDYGDLLMKGDFKLQGAKTCRHVFLFTKAVILAKKREVDGEIRYRKAIIKGSDLMLIESVPKEPLCFHLIHYSTPRKLYALQAKSLDEKRAWCIGIKQLIINSLPCTIPDRSKRLLLSTGLDNGTDKVSNGEANDLLSPLADGVQPMSSLAAVAAAAAAAAAPSSKQTWLKSPNLLLRSNARQVPDYLERRQRKSSQFRSYIDLSHFVRKHLARRSDSALSHGAYLESRGKQAVGDDVNSGVINGEDQSPKVALSPSEHSLSNSLCHWDSCNGLARCRSLGSLDLESCRGDTQCTDLSYDDCCSRANRLARELAEKGPGERASMPWTSQVPQKRRLLNDITRKSKHRTAFRSRPEEEPSCEVSPTASAVSEIEVVFRSPTAMDQEGREWPELRRDVTLSSDEGYERGAESDFHEMVPLGSVSNRSSGADFSPPSRCSVVSSDTGSSSNEPCAENNDDGDEDASDTHCRLPVGTASAELEGQHQIEACTSKAATTGGDEPAPTDACPTADFGRSALSTASVSGSGELGLDTSATAHLVDNDPVVHGAVVDPTSCAASAVSAAVAVDPASSCDIEFSRFLRRGSDRSLALRNRNTAAAAANAMSSQSNRIAEQHASEDSTDGRPQACGHDDDTTVSVAVSTSHLTVGQKPTVQLSPPSSRCSQPIGVCNEQQPQLPNKRDNSATKPPVPARPSVVRLARQYSTKIKERPALQASSRRDSATQLRHREKSREAQLCNENDVKQLSTSKHCMTTLPEQGGMFHEDGHDKQGTAATPEVIGGSSASTSYLCKAEDASNGQRLEFHKHDLPSAPPLCSESRARDSVVSPSENVATGEDHTDVTDSRRPRSSRHAVSAALRERMRSLERPPVVSRVFSYADVECQQVDSLRDRIRMLQTNSSAGATATVVAVDEGIRFRELTPPCASTARKSSAAAVLTAYTRCQSVPSDTAERHASGLHKPVATQASSSCGIAAGRAGRKVSRVEDAAIASGHVRNIVQKFQVH